MDIDVPAASTSKSSESRTVFLPDPSVFDLESYAANYEGRRRAQRLLFIGKHCPTLALDAFALAAETLKASTLDHALYTQAVTEYNSALAFTPASAGKSSLKLDDKWVDATKRSAAKELDKLEVELKNYQNNLIKESIRMGHRDLGAFYHRSGDLQQAIKSYTKSRDFCTTAPHVVEMCLSVIDVALEMQNYALVRNYVIKAEAAMEGGNSSSSHGGAAGGASGSGAGASSGQTKPKPVNLPGMAASGPTKEEQERERERSATLERLYVAHGVAELGSGNYLSAANQLLRIGPNARSSDAQHYISTGDIALFSVLCGLAFYDRGLMKRKLIENTDLRPLLEAESFLKEVISAFHESKYKLALEILERYQPRASLDLHLNPHVTNLMVAIKNRAVVQYFAPFNSVSLGRMAGAFGFAEAQMLQNIISLVEGGDLKARIDTKNKILKAHAPSQRTTVFREAIEVGEQIDASNRALLLRMKLVQHDLIVKEPKMQKNNKGGGDEQMNG